MRLIYDIAQCGIEKQTDKIEREREREIERGRAEAKAKAMSACCKT